MRILYGVVGEGMGHATRSRIVLEHLWQRGHELQVVVSGRAHAFLRDKFKDRPRIHVEEIHGLHLRFDGNALDLGESVRSNLEAASPGVQKNLAVWKAIDDRFHAQAVISDFESFAFVFARARGLPLISIDNMQIINRCEHDAFVTDDKSIAYRIAKMAVKSKIPGAYHYLVSSFFYPKVKKPRTTLVPPILRPEILNARREPGEHVLVYQTAAANAETLLATLQRLPFNFKAYGTGQTGTLKNVECLPFSETGFIDDLRTARCAVAGGGYSLMGEAVHLHVPLLAMPIAGQYEQELNARYLEQLGYGRRADAVSANEIEAFVAQSADIQHTLERYVPRDNSILLDCVDELVEAIRLGEPPPAVLQSTNLGHYDAPMAKHLERAMRDD